MINVVYLLVYDCVLLVEQIHLVLRFNNLNYDRQYTFGLNTFEL